MIPKTLPTSGPAAAVEFDPALIKEQGQTPVKGCLHGTDPGSWARRLAVANAEAYSPAPHESRDVKHTNNYPTYGRIHMSNRLRLVSGAALAALACANVTAFADDHAYSEGPVVNVSMIRTVDGKFDDYMQWLDTTWKAEQEASKKAGYIQSYEVLTANPQGPNDPDVLLVITYKNWAALDGALAKGDQIAKQVEGSVSAANQSEADRSKIRRVLGSQTMQVATLK